jgi:hypothetical protein
MSGCGGLRPGIALFYSGTDCFKFKLFAAAQNIRQRAFPALVCKGDPPGRPYQKHRDGWVVPGASPAGCAAETAGAGKANDFGGGPFFRHVQGRPGGSRFAGNSARDTGQLDRAGDFGWR